MESIPRPESTKIKPKVDIGIACNINQSFQWWSSIINLVLSEERLGKIQLGQIRTLGSALPDYNKNNIVGDTEKRSKLTDANRSQIMKGFISGDSDYIFWIDDDTAPPLHAISALVDSGKLFIGGVYFMTSPPYHPIAYKRYPETGLYAPVYDFPKGAIMQIDSIGMGCTLIHRHVYEKIMQTHQVFERDNGSLAVIHNSQISSPPELGKEETFKAYVSGGVYHEVYKTQGVDDDRVFPFYQLEYGRTEDHFFCELAIQAGIHPYLDTGVICRHWKMGNTSYDDYNKYLLEDKGLI